MKQVAYEKTKIEKRKMEDSMLLSGSAQKRALLSFSKRFLLSFTNNYLSKIHKTISFPIKKTYFIVSKVLGIYLLYVNILVPCKFTNHV